MSKKPIRTIVFEDKGQDFLEWDIQGTKILDSRPFQAWVWTRKLITNSGELEVGGYVELYSREGPRKINYKIIEIKKKK